MGNDSDIIRDSKKGKQIEIIGGLRLVELNIGTDSKPAVVYRAFDENGVLIFIDTDIVKLKQRCIESDYVDKVINVLDEKELNEKEMLEDTVDCLKSYIDYAQQEGFSFPEWMSQTLKQASCSKVGEETINVLKTCIGYARKNGFPFPKGMEKELDDINCTLETYAESLYNLGLDFYYKEDYLDAKLYFTKAVEEGNAHARFRLGWLYEHGLGVERSYTIAKEWYEQAAELGNMDAMNAIGRMYYVGLGMEQDYILARAWYERAAALGDSNSMFALSAMDEGSE